MSYFSIPEFKKSFNDRLSSPMSEATQDLFMRVCLDLIREYSCDFGTAVDEFVLRVDRAYAKIADRPIQEKHIQGLKEWREYNGDIETSFHKFQKQVYVIIRDYVERNFFYVERKPRGGVVRLTKMSEDSVVDCTQFPFTANERPEWECFGFGKKVITEDNAATVQEEMEHNLMHHHIVHADPIHAEELMCALEDIREFFFSTQWEKQSIVIEIGEDEAQD